MSYILEALKKLEQRRQHESGPTLLTFQGSPLQPPRRRRLWLYVFSAAFLLNAALVFWWIEPWRAMGRRWIPPQNEPPRKITATTPVAVPDIRAQSNPTVDKNQARANEKKEATPPVAKQNPEAIAPKADPAPASKGARAPVRQDQSVGDVRKERKPPTNGRILKLADLPAAVASSLPEIKMALHYYTADPQSRFARINDKTLREGQFLSEGVKVEEINAGGVVMSYQGYRFRIGINENPAEPSP